jgi:hypothetical protein
MADKKISQLSAASTPLAGTEVLPVVQAGSTVKVAANDLTVKNVRSNATTGILQIAGPVAASTRVMTVPDANFTSARIDAAQSFTGDQTLSTGNLVIGTASKGVDFSANTNAAGMTSELLTWYEEGTWTPTVISVSGTITSFGAVTGTYTRTGRVVFLTFSILITDNGTGAGGLRVSGLPFSITGVGAGSGRENGVSGVMIQTIGLQGDAYFTILTYDNGYPGGTNAKPEGFIQYIV